MISSLSCVSGFLWLMHGAYKYRYHRVCMVLACLACSSRVNMISSLSCVSGFLWLVAHINIDTTASAWF